MTLKLVQIYNLKLKKNIQNRIFSAMLVDTKTGFKPNPPPPRKKSNRFSVMETMTSFQVLVSITIKDHRRQTYVSELLK